MKQCVKATVLAAILLLWICISNYGLSFAQEKRDMGGWGKDSSYNQLYNPAEIDSFKGLVIKTVKAIPLPGMSPGVALIVRERGNENAMVHIGPKWFIGKVGIKKGDKAKGVWAEI
jgi:hypothetical protein